MSIRVNNSSRAEQNWSNQWNTKEQRAWKRRASSSNQPAIMRGRWYEGHELKWGQPIKSRRVVIK